MLCVCTRGRQKTKLRSAGGKVVKCLGAATTTQEEEEEGEHGRKPQRDEAVKKL